MRLCSLERTCPSDADSQSDTLTWLPLTFLSTLFKRISCPFSIAQGIYVIQFQLYVH